MANKQVKFFQPILVARNGTRRELSPGFWQDVRDTITPLDRDGRTVSYRLAPYLGEAATGRAVAHDYIRVGRVRREGDWPEVVEADGTVGPLDLTNNADIYEGAYLVPFGTENRVAFMGPLRGSIVSISAVARWLTAVLNLHRTSETLELVPEADPLVVRKLDEAAGLTKLRVNLPRGTVPDTPETGRGQIEDAILHASSAGEDKLNVEVGFSFGHATPHGPLLTQMKSTAQRLLRQGGATKIEVGMLLEDEDGSHIETVDLLKNKVSVTVELPSDDTYRMSTDEILDAIDTAIKEFRRLSD